MKIVVLILILFSCVKYSEAQESIQLPPCKYKVWISLISTGNNIKGILYDVKDSSAMFIYYPILNDSKSQKPVKYDINYEMVNIVKTRKKIAPIIWTLSGVLAGGLVGGLYGYQIEKNIVYESFVEPKFTQTATFACGL